MFRMGTRSNGIFFMFSFEITFIPFVSFVFFFIFKYVIFNWKISNAKQHKSLKNGWFDFFILAISLSINNQKAHMGGVSITRNNAVISFIANQFEEKSINLNDEYNLFRTLWLCNIALYFNAFLRKFTKLITNFD